MLTPEHRSAMAPVARRYWLGISLVSKPIFGPQNFMAVLRFSGIIVGLCFSNASSASWRGLRGCKGVCCYLSGGWSAKLGRLWGTGVCHQRPCILSSCPLLRSYGLWRWGSQLLWLVDQTLWWLTQRRYDRSWMWRLWGVMVCCWTWIWCNILGGGGKSMRL